MKEKELLNENPAEMSENLVDSSEREMGALSDDRSIAGSKNDIDAVFSEVPSEESDTAEFDRESLFSEKTAVQTAPEQDLDVKTDDDQPARPRGQRLKKRSDEQKNSIIDRVKHAGMKRINDTTSRRDENHRGLPKKNEKGFKNLLTWQKILVVLAAFFIVGCVVAFTLYQVNREDISGYVYTTREKTQVISADNVVIGELFSENRTYISLDQVPKDLINAIVATEDSRFYSHNGVDIIGIARSLVGNILSLNATGQGGSTVTQQLARTLFLPSINTEGSTWSSIVRKLKEISIAWQLDQKYTKDQIMEMFLNETYFGSAAYGIEEAAETYFGKTISECNLAECAMLAGLPQAPSAYAPNSDFDAAKRRQKEVLDRMVSEKYITREQADEAWNTEIVIVPWSPEDVDNQITSGYSAFVSYAFEEYAASQAEEVMKQQGVTREEAIKSIRRELASGGYKIYTTIDSRFQEAALENVIGTMDRFGEEYTGALVTVENDGAIRAYYGGNTDIDMADSPRQPGSGIKPLYYSCAFEKGIATPNTTVVDEPTTFYGTYSPQNDENIYMGAITYESALVHSSNICSIKLFDQIGPDQAIEWMKNMGITTFVDDDINLATAIGGMTHGIKPLEMAAAYNVMNNSGVYNQPYAVKEIQKTNGDIIFTKNGYKLDSHRVMTDDTAATMWRVMQGVVRYGTGTNASNALPTAGKTGTTDSHQDLWFNGMTSAYTTSIWCGSLENETLNSTSNMVAGIYGNYMQTLYNNDVVTQ